MKRLLIALGVVVMTTPLMGANCNTVVRDETVFKTELDFWEQTSKQPADKLVEWINKSCTCTDGAWSGGNSDLCLKSAKLVQVIRTRVPYHKAMALYNASVTDKRPPKEAPKVPSHTDLCPATPGS
jgi:hypothetical protein